MHDSKVVRNLLEQVEGDIVCVIGDGAYDTRSVYENMRYISPGAKVVILPRRSARIWYRKVESSFLHPRDENLKSGSSKWREYSEYCIRSKVLQWLEQKKKRKQKKKEEYSYMPQP